MNGKFSFVDILDGVEKIINQSISSNQKFFPVLENYELVGVVSYKELMQANPNRIIADVMNKNYFFISSEETIWNANNVFDRYDSNYLLVIEDEKTIGILEKSRLLLEIIKYYDPLTTMYTSTYLYANAFELIKDGYNISVLFIDINNFGKINKDYGHTIGDEVIKTLAFVLKENTPDDMFFCRYAGDEFALLNTLNLKECKQLALKLQEIISSLIFFNKINISISIGVVSNVIFNDLSQNESINKLINLASLASTKAKDKENNIYVVNDINVNEIESTF